MASWVVLLSLLLALTFRQTLERQTVLNLAENVFLIALTQYTSLSWAICPVILAFFLASAFLQTQVEYFNWDQQTKSQCTRGAQLTCMSKTEDAQCPSFTPSSEGPDSKSTILEDKDNAVSDGSSAESLSVYGKVTMYPCVLRHIRLAGGFKDDFAHSYLYIGVPLGLRECYSPLLSVDSPPDSRPWYNKAFFSIRPEDQFLRGGASLSISQKLKEFLLLDVCSTALSSDA